MLAKRGVLKVAQSAGLDDHPLGNQHMHNYLFGYSLEKWWQITQTFYMKHVYQNACAGAVFHGSTSNLSRKRLDLERKIGKIVVSSGRVVQDLKCLLRDGDLHA